MTSSDELSLYDILGIVPGASQEEIRCAFRIAAKQHHPDMGGSREMFEEIRRAYEMLEDERQRRRYDTARKILEQIEQEEIKQEYNPSPSPYPWQGIMPGSWVSPTIFTTPASAGLFSPPIQLFTTSASAGLFSPPIQSGSSFSFFWRQP